MNADRIIAAVVVAAYFMAAIVFLPPDEHLRALGLGAAVFAAVALIGRKIGPGPITWIETYVVIVIAAAVLVFPTFPAMGGRHVAAMWIGAWGTHAAALLWASLRWDGNRPAPTSLGFALAMSAGIALLFSIVATVPIAIVGITGQPEWPSALLIYPAYFGGGLAAGTVYWVLQRWSRLVIGRYLIGTLCGACVYGAIMPVAAFLDGDPVRLGEILEMAFVLGGLVGPPIALGWDQMDGIPYHIP